MTKKQIIILLALVVFLAAVIIFGFVFNPRKSVTFSSPAVQNIFNKIATSTNQSFTSQIPAGAILTKPKSEAPASPSGNAKLLFFDMKISASGFNPSALTVNQGDTVHVNLIATDGAYDFYVPSTGLYSGVLKPGGAAKFAEFSLNQFGSFLFECRDYCPLGGKIQGMLVVLPNK